MASTNALAEEATTKERDQELRSTWKIKRRLIQLYRHAQESSDVDMVPETVEEMEPIQRETFRQSEPRLGINLWVITLICLV